MRSFWKHLAFTRGNVKETDFSHANLRSEGFQDHIWWAAAITGILRSVGCSFCCKWKHQWNKFRFMCLTSTLNSPWSNNWVEGSRFGFRDSCAVFACLTQNMQSLSPQLGRSILFMIVNVSLQCRQDDAQLRQMLEERAAQFRAIQKRLLTRFKDKTPAPLANLDTLLNGTYTQVKCSRNILISFV